MLENSTITSSNNEYKVSKIMYVLFAAFEYFISIAVGGTYIGRIATYAGIPDAYTAILTSLLALGSTFQVFALFIAHIRPVKKWVVPLQILSQLLFVFIYFIPILEGGEVLKTVLLFVTLILAHFILNLVCSPKTNWMISLIDDGKRGEFTAIKEIVSLISGSLFVYLLGWMLDLTNQKQAFVLVGIVLIVITVLETVSLLFIKEKPYESVEKTNVIEIIKKLIKNKAFVKVVVVFMLWAVVHLGARSFLGTYQAKELAFTAEYSSIIIIIGSISRALISQPLGRFGDKNSFTKMLIVTFILALISQVFLAFTTPSNGKVLYMLYYIFDCLGMAGLNSAMTNLTYAVVEPTERTGAFAVMHVMYGGAGFLSTLALTPILNAIQGSGNVVFGISMYAQQFFAIISIVIIAVLIIWLILNLKHSHKKEIS